jgi:hypothetical protein
MTGESKRVPQTGEPEPDRDEARDDAVSPLGRGAPPARPAEPAPLEGRGIAGPRGAGAPGAQGGPAGPETRDDEDSLPRARRDVH